MRIEVLGPLRVVGDGLAEPTRPSHRRLLAKIRWTRNLFAAVQGHGAGAVYTNYVDRDESDRVEEAWGASQARLRRVKAVYDPDDVFIGNVGLGSG